MRYPLLAVLLAAIWLGGLSCAGSSETSLSLDDYFRQMADVNKRMDDRFATDVFHNQQSARTTAEAFATVAAEARDSYADIQPPAQAKDAHQELVLAIGDAASTMGDTANLLRVLAKAGHGEAPPDQFQRLVFGTGDTPVAKALARVDKAICAVQRVADDMGISAEVGCQFA